MKLNLQLSALEFMTTKRQCAFETVFYLFCKGIPSILNSKKINTFPRYIKIIYRNKTKKAASIFTSKIWERSFVGCVCFHICIFLLVKTCILQSHKSVSFFFKVNRHWSPCAHFMAAVTWWHSWPHRSGMSLSVSPHCQLQNPMWLGWSQKTRFVEKQQKLCYTQSE